MMIFFAIFIIFKCFSFLVEANDDLLMNYDNEYSSKVSIEVSFVNELEFNCSLCWKESYMADIFDDYNLCQNIAGSPSNEFLATVGQLADLYCNSSYLSTIELMGGKHIYSIKEALMISSEIEKPMLASEIAFVRTPNDCVDFGGFAVIGMTWRDAVRRAAYRLSYGLCFCGEFNQSTTFTIYEPNEELPTMYSGKTCNCDSPLDNDFDLWLPCSFDSYDPIDLSNNVNCNIIASDSNKPQEHYRVHLIHTTTFVDRLSLKNKMWDSLKRLYGVDRASMIMPRTYDLTDNNDSNEFEELCKNIVLKNEGRNKTFIMKDAYQHRQHGIMFASADYLLKNGLVDNFNMATIFLPRPFLINGYKLNMRRYLVAVCTGNRLRAYVHDDGKNIYSRRPYREPWQGEPWEGDRAGEVDRLEEMVTSGYVPVTHYLDKPMTGSNLFAELEERHGISPELLQSSMWTRLALTVHMSIHDGMFNLCETEGRLMDSDSVPRCLLGAVRYQHFGCDFHIDEEFNGYDSRLFECNKGPDFSVHSYGDGKLKRDVAADILSFIGFKGEFLGTEEHARQHRMNFIYDSESFDPEEAFRFLDSLKDRSVQMQVEDGMTSATGATGTTAHGVDEREEL